LAGHSGFTYERSEWARKKEQRGRRPRRPTIRGFSPKPEAYTITLKNARAKGIHLDHINGYVYHVHCLISMNAKQDIADIVQALKGESSFWVNNKTELLKHRLQWCDDYYAVSIGASGLDAVRAYIRNQEAHHGKKTFEEECEEFMQVYGFERMLE